MSIEFYWIAVAAVLITSAARMTRLATWDEFPPAVYLREKYAALTDKTDRRRGWQLLAYCGYCASFWITALLVIWGDVAGVFDGRTAWGTDGDLAVPIWFLINGTFGASYLAAILMANDGDNGDEGDDN